MNTNFSASTNDSTSNQLSPEMTYRQQTNRTYGFASYSRQILLEALAQGARLKVKGAGVCHFESDIDADLAEQAIAVYAFKGKLLASPEVTAVLLRKKV